MKTQTFACSPHMRDDPQRYETHIRELWVLYISGLHQIQLK